MPPWRCPPWDPSQPFGERAIDEGVENQKEAGEARVDQARPMGIVAQWRRQARLVQIEPALAGQERAHLDQPQRIVRVVHRDRRHRPILGHQLHQDQEPGQAKKENEVRLARHGGEHGD
jgi:hypothetical protein